MQALGRILTSKKTINSYAYCSFKFNAAKAMDIHSDLSNKVIVAQPIKIVLLKIY